ncbi:MAG: efflux RND transporter permease subunit [Terrimicrobiaceae bacterium]|nr:efflux RND transporter permease subunit [Terrimicrobiaceae bacterium]
MWIVLFALRYKYTVAVFAIAIALFGLLSASRMSTDIMPQVDSPEILVVWTYSGLNAREMASKITSFGEIATLNNVDDVVEVRSETLNGIGLVKIRFQPFVDIDRALAQVTSVSQTMVRRMPQGTQPPLIVLTSPSSVPILQLVISSTSMSDGALFDWARLALRAQIQSIPGIRLSLPYGGASRQIMVDIDAEALHSLGLSAADVSRALASQNLTLPSGSLREDGREIPVAVNASPESVEGFLDLPLRSVDGRVVRLRDVAHVRDGEAVSTNIARLNGQNAVLVSILKLGGASTLEIIGQILERLPAIRASAPPGLQIEPIFDQSVFVGAAIDTVRKEIIIVGCLVALMVLLFLGSWRSTLIVLTSIPLALLSSVIGLYLSGATFNLMSLGGLALAIGILVDNALVEIENINRQIAGGKPVRQAILDGARQVAFPELVSTTGICIVFTPIFLLSGTAADVFQPLALAVIYAMIASYILSRTLVPTLAAMLLPGELAAKERAADRKPGPLTRTHLMVEHLIDQGAVVQRRILTGLVRRAWVAPVAALAVAGLGVLAWSGLGREFFPVTDAGLMRLFVRVPSGVRVEETAARFAEIQREIRRMIPAEDLLFIAENIGTPSSVNLAWIESTAVGSYDGEILIQLAPGGRRTAGYTAAIRKMLTEKFPDVQAFFRPADATSQTLSGGAPTAFEVRLIGRDVPGNIALANQLVKRLQDVPGAVDVTLREVLDLPEYFLEIDRTRAAQLGISQQDAVGAVLTALGAGGSVAPTFWSDPKIGASYEVNVGIPPNDIPGREKLMNLPVRPSGGGPPVVLSAFATLNERKTPATVSRTTLLPTLTVLANVQDTDIGSVLRELDPILDELRKNQKPGNRIEVAGQAALMNSAYTELFGGLALAAALIFLVMVVNFQSWSLPFVSISGLPVAMAGAFVGLWVTGTPLSVPALMGLIMVVGVSTANSVLVTSFAQDLWRRGLPGAQAAVEAATTRLRPVCMTALTMILGVLPMALGFGEGGEQNAPLGRAVIGGLAFGTFASLLLVPFVFSMMKRRPPCIKDAIEPEPALAS